MLRKLSFKRRWIVKGDKTCLVLNAAKHFFLLTDVDDCRSSPCIHGSCTNNINGYNCTCAPGNTGSSCDIG